MKISTIAAVDGEGRIGVDGDLLFDFQKINVGLNILLHVYNGKRMPY